MDASKWNTLIEYRSEGKSSLDAKTLTEICTMYCDKEISQEELLKICEAFVGNECTPARAISEVVSGESETATKLREFILAHSADSNKPVSSALSSLLDEDLQEDDDDEEAGCDDEGEESTKKPAIEPVMRGVLEFSGDKTIWSGKWAMSKELFDSGEKSKFKYSCSQKGSLESPPSGKFSGYFMVKNDDKSRTKVEEKNCSLNFSKKPDSKMLNVQGEGKNAYGEFTLNGIYDPKSGRLSIVKSYKPSDDDFHDDGEDAEGDSEIEDEDPDDMARELAELQSDALEDIESVRKRVNKTHESSDKKKKPKH